MSDFHAAMSLAIHQLYEALLDPAAFQPAIEAMSHAMGGRRVMLLNWNGVVSNAPDLVSTFAANGPSFDSFFEQYNSHYHPDDPAKHSWPAIAENDWLQYDGDQPSSDCPTARSIRISHGDSRCTAGRCSKSQKTE